MLWHAFKFAPAAALAVLVCLATILWCSRLLRKVALYRIDRFLLGFIGLLAVYQGLRLLNEIGVLTVFSSPKVSGIVELLVAVLYLLAASIMRLSSEQRQYADFQIRSARAAPRVPLRVLRPVDSTAPAAGDRRSGRMHNVAELMPVLTDAAFKLYVFLGTRTDPATDCAFINGETLIELGKTFDEVLFLLEELEMNGVCKRTHIGPAAISVQLALSREPELCGGLKV